MPITRSTPMTPTPPAVPAARASSLPQDVRSANPIRGLQQFGQSVWLDYLRRSLFTGGEFKRLIEEDGLRGATSNPSIFEKAIAGSTEYLDALHEIEGVHDAEPMVLYEALAIRDIRDAADLLRPVYDATLRADGYVSLEVSPYLAHDADATIAEARRLWKAVNRQNVMIKVPASREGLPAIRQLISEGINVNITLLFGIDRYEAVARAYVEGLSLFVQKGGDPARVCSVASFFVSRIDTMVDGLIEARLSATKDAAARTALTSLLGVVAIANAKLAYQRYLELCRSTEWRALAARGAHPQRLLWASTSTKNPRYRDVRYIEELIGPETVNTITPATLDAFRDHGRLRNSLGAGLTEARDILEALGRSGISLREVTDQLLEDGVTLFCKAFDSLLDVVDRARRSQLTSMLDRQCYTLPHDDAAVVAAAVDDWQASGKARRLWARDATLWTGHEEDRWLGWLDITGDQLTHVGRLQDVSREIAHTGVSHVVVLGMGGSSLAAEVIRCTFGASAGFPELHVLDSTDPAQIAGTEGLLDMRYTLFVVSSKSGTTLEPTLLLEYFLTRMKTVVGEANAGSHFIAITDPGSPLQKIAERERFRQVFLGVPDIGGRYSALSNFGLVPAALMGVDVARLLNRTELMVHSCAASVPGGKNPAVILGVILGALARAGRDKVTLIMSPRIASLGAWLEQLIAESTGKHGKGLIPVDREAIGSVGVYGHDRVFVYTRLESGPDLTQDAAVDALERAGQPVVRIVIADVYDIGQEFFRWELAVAVAGAVMGVNPFDQPDVEASKIVTRELTSTFERMGRFPDETPLCAESGLTLFADAWNAAVLEQAAGGDRSIAGYMRAHMQRIRPGNYVAILAYLTMSQPHTDLLQAIRHMVRDRQRVATCLEYGPRFLHSTGQAYKGGPNTGLFLQLTCDDTPDLSVPGRKLSFGAAKAAAARGDFAVLADRRRRVLRVHIDGDVDTGLRALRSMLATVVEG